MPEFIRLKNKKTGAEFTASADIEVGDDVEVLDDKPATSGDGKPLSPKYKTTLTDSGSEGPKPVEIPAGEPDEAWTVKQIEAFAAREQIDLGDASTKVEKLSAVTTPKE